MSPWERGSADVERLVMEGRLEVITESAAVGEGLVARAERDLAAARRVADVHPEPAYTLAYDAARKAATALLAKQGLRARGAESHSTTAEAASAQFNGSFSRLNAMRRVRNELEYASTPKSAPTAHDVDDAIGHAEKMVEAGKKLLPTLGIFTPSAL